MRVVEERAHQDYQFGSDSFRDRFLRVLLARMTTPDTALHVGDDRLLRDAAAIPPNQGTVPKFA